MQERTRGEPATDDKPIRWSAAIFLAISHVAAIAALFFWSWPAIVCAVILYWIAGSLGIGMGFHRLLTHRGYQVPRLVEYFRWSNSVGDHA